MTAHHGNVRRAKRLARDTQHFLVTHFLVTHTNGGKTGVAMAHIEAHSITSALVKFHKRYPFRVPGAIGVLGEEG